MNINFVHHQKFIKSISSSFLMMNRVFINLKMMNSDEIVMNIDELMLNIDETDELMN